jgi:subtilase family serine protease
MRRTTRATLLAAAAAALALALTASAAGAVRPVPAVTGHIDRHTLSFPPDTAYCQAHFGISCYQPAQFQRAYDMGPLYAQGLDGHGKTIVLVDSFGSPTIQHDLGVFDATFGLPDPPSLKVIQPAGAVPPYDPTNGDMVGWAQETTLDVEWSHAMAPGANILLVETPVSETEGVQGFPQIVRAEEYVVNHGLGDVISQSFGATEPTFPSVASIFQLRGAFVDARAHGVTVLGSSGDNGATDNLPDLTCCYPYRVNSWPSSDPLVTSVGGTQLFLDAAGNRLSPDVVWNDGFGAGGGGLSSVFVKPQFQFHAGIPSGKRGTPDVSLSAAVDGGVVVYTSFGGYPAGYHIFGGTSEASPLFAGIVSIADQAAGHDLGWINPFLYRLGQGHDPSLVDVTEGNNSLEFIDANNNDVFVQGFDAGPGYDLASGLGTIDGAQFVAAASRTVGDGGPSGP